MGVQTPLISCKSTIGFGNHRSASRPQAQLPSACQSYSIHTAIICPPTFAEGLLGDIQRAIDSRRESPAGHNLAAVHPPLAGDDLGRRHFALQPLDSACHRRDLFAVQQAGFRKEARAVADRHDNFSILGRFLDPLDYLRIPPRLEYAAARQYQDIDLRMVVEPVLWRDREVPGSLDRLIRRGHGEHVEVRMIRSGGIQKHLVRAGEVDHLDPVKQEDADILLGLLVYGRALRRLIEPELQKLEPVMYPAIARRRAVA